MENDNSTVTITLELKAETTMAWLVIDWSGEEHWLPKSQATRGARQQGRHYDFEVKVWLAELRELV